MKAIVWLLVVDRSYSPLTAGGQTLTRDIGLFSEYAKVLVAQTPRPSPSSNCPCSNAVAFPMFTQAGMKIGLGRTAGFRDDGNARSGPRRSQSMLIPGHKCRCGDSRDCKPSRRTMRTPVCVRTGLGGVEPGLDTGSRGWPCNSCLRIPGCRWR